MNRDIYVSVPSQNDAEFIPTVLRCLENASNKKNIKIGSSIFWKKEDIENGKSPFFLEMEKVFSKIDNVNFDILPFDYFPGVGNGRVQSLKFYNNEKYYLSIDSHTQFEPGWDENLIESYEKTRKTFGKRRVLTSYLPGYDIDEDHNITFLDNNPKWQFFSYDPTRSKNIPVPDDKTLTGDNIIIYDHLVDDTYLPAKKISAHFTFTEADYWINGCRINLDPRIIFWAEEFYQSALAYSRGYNLAWTKEIFMRHYYSSSLAKNINSEEGTVNLSNHEKPRSFRDEKMEKDSDINNIYKDYIKDKIYRMPHIINEEHIIKELMEKGSFFGDMIRSPQGFCKYSSVNLQKKTCSSWTEVPKLDVIFK